MLAYVEGLAGRAAEALRQWRRQVVVIAWAANAMRLISQARYHDALALVARAENLSSGIGKRLCRAVLRRADNDLRRRGLTWSGVWNGSETSGQVRIRFASGDQRDFVHANIMVLKPFRPPNERGVLAIKYSEIIEAFPVLFDVPRVQRRFHLVLEPSWTGHMQTFVRTIDPRKCVVAVQSLTLEDSRQFAERGLVSLPICAGDWVDENTFRIVSSVEKRFDFAMVSNFISWKRHEYVFSALQRHWVGPLSFALVGSSFVGEGVERVRDLLRRYALSDNGELFIDVMPATVNSVLNASYCHVLASMREGANRATFEALFAGIPVIVPSGHIGFPKWRFPRELVLTFTGRRDLVAKIRQARADSDTASRAEIAARLSGSLNATRIVAESIAQEAIRRGEPWTSGLFRHVNRVHISHYLGADFDTCEEDYRYLETSVRDGFRYDRALARALLLRGAA